MGTQKSILDIDILLGPSVHGMCSLTSAMTNLLCRIKSLVASRPVPSETYPLWGGVTLTVVEVVVVK